MRIPKLLKTDGMLGHYADYPKGSAERAKAICIMLLAQLEAVESSYGNYESKKEIAKREKVWEPLGAKDLDELFVKLTGKTEVEADAAKKSQRASQATTGVVLPRHKHPDSKISDQRQTVRAKASGISHYTQRKLDRLARDHKSLHARVSAGELSVHAACIAAGIVKVKTPAEQAIAALKKCDTRQWNQVVDWMSQQH